MSETQAPEAQASDDDGGLQAHPAREAPAESTQPAPPQTAADDLGSSRNPAAVGPHLTELGADLGNPLRDPADRRLPRVPEPCALVIFGIGGDLSRKKLIPAVYDLANRGLLPTDFVLVGFSRADWPGGGSFESLARKCAKDGARTGWNEEVWHRLAGNTRFVEGSFDDDDAFDELVEVMEGLRESHGIQGNAAFYLSIPPSLFPMVLKQMQRTGLSDADRAKGWRRVVVEKPFGHDLPSALELNGLVDSVFPARDVYRIDHYLGKETVQNLLALRFANMWFEPLWNGNYVDSVQITMAEDVGIGGRAAFYDATGAARDVLQNHLLQLLALTAMEEPVEFSPEPVRIEKLKVLRAISLPSDLEAYAIRGQYDQGWLAGERAVAYREEDGIPDDSNTETYAAVRFGIETRRWAGVPFYLRTGKRLPEARHRDRDAVQEGAAPAVQQDRHPGAGAQPARHPGAARRGRHAQVRLQGAGQRHGGARRRDGLPLRRGVHRVLPRGLRAADARRAGRRRHAVPAQRGGRGVLAGHRPARAVLGRAHAVPVPRRRVGSQGGRRDARPRRPTVEATVR